MERVAGPHVIIVEDHRVLAEGLAGVLAARGFSTQTITGNGVADLSGLLAEVHAAPTVRPVVLIDLRLGDGLDGSTFVAPLVDQGAAVLVLTGWSTDLQAARCLASGALGVLRKSLSVEELVQAVTRAAAGDAVTTTGEQRRLLATLATSEAEEEARLAPFADLSPQEEVVLEALVQGRRAKEIARERGVSVTTVRSQIGAILAKLNVHSQLAAVSAALETGWRPRSGRGW